MLAKKGKTLKQVQGDVNELKEKLQAENTKLVQMKKTNSDFEVKLQNQLVQTKSEEKQVADELQKEKTVATGLEKQLKSTQSEEK